MEYLDRYLEAVKKHLPWQRQDDILAELRANLESQLEEREEALGRPMRAAEAEAWVKELSPPIQVAAGYQPQQYLIGPAVFPAYRHVLKLACSWCMIVYAIVTVARFFAAPQPDTDTLLVAFLRIPGVLLITSAWITLIFAAIEYAMMHRFIPLHTLGPLSELWPPSLLTQHEPQTAGKKPPSYAKAVAEVIFGFLWLVWLLLIPQHPFLILGFIGRWWRSTSCRWAGSLRVCGMEGGRDRSHCGRLCFRQWGSFRLDLCLVRLVMCFFCSRTRRRRWRPMVEISTSSTITSMPVSS
jgi:hypothetical protein